MSIKMNIDIADAKKLLDSGDKKVIEAIEKSMIQVGGFMEGEVKSSIAGQRAEPRSVDTGNFLSSIKNTPDKTSVVISSDVEYAAQLEYGTGKRKPRRHFQNSAERNRDKINKYVLDQIKEA